MPERIQKNIKAPVQKGVDGDKAGVAVKIGRDIRTALKASEILPGGNQPLLAYKSINNSKPNTNEGNEYPKILKTRATWSMNLL